MRDAAIRLATERLARPVLPQASMNLRQPVACGIGCAQIQIPASEKLIGINQDG